MEQIIKLTYGSCTAEFQLLGAQIVSFKAADGREVIWQGDPAVWKEHAPVLFPICGGVMNGEVSIGGKFYPMPTHGFAQASLFRVHRIGTDFIDIILEASDETRRMYPFSFSFHVNYTLHEEGYTTTFLVENHDEKVMPFCIGGHPGYVLPMEEGAVFEDYQLLFDELEDGKSYMTPGGGLVTGWEYLPGFHNERVLPLDYDTISDHQAFIFAGLKSRGVSLVHKKSGKGLRVEFPEFGVLAVWTQRGARAPYLCVEPWNGLPENINEPCDMEKKPYVTLLAPGKTYRASFTTMLLGG